MPVWVRQTTHDTEPRRWTFAADDPGLSGARDQAMLTEQIVGLSLSAAENPAVLPILADAIEEAGSPAFAAEVRNGMIDRPALDRLAAADAAFFAAESAACQQIADDIAARAESARLTAFRRTAFARCGVTGPKDSVSGLMAGITRKRPKGSGSRRDLAQRLHDRLTELAERRWVRACKGQRRPTPKQAAELVERIESALTVQSRCKERTLTVQDVIRTARNADADGTAYDDGGKVTAASYKYRWTTTTAGGARQPDGTVRVSVSRSGSATVTAPAKHWRDVTVAADVLRLPGAEFGIRQSDGSFKVYAADCRELGVAVPMPADLQSRFGKWEHGTDAAACLAEIEHKRAVVAKERADHEEFTRNAEQIARERIKAERRAKLLARIGTQTHVSYADARACGMCDAGIRAFAAKVGITDTTATVPLADVFRHEPAYAVKLAKRILEQRQVNAA